MANWVKTSSGLVLPGSSSSSSRKQSIPGTERKVAKLGGIHFWAEHGMICWTDQSTGKYGQMTVKSAREQLPKIASHIGTSSDPGLERDPQERKKLLDELPVIQEVIKIAQRQMQDKLDNIKHGRRG